MNRQYIDAIDKNVATTILYADKTAGNLFVDETKTTKADKETVEHLFFVGMKVVLSGEYLTPTGLKTNGSGVTVTAYNGTTAVTFSSAEVSA